MVTRTASSSKKSITAAAAEAAQQAVSSARATLTTYRNELRKIEQEKAAAEKALTRGQDDATTGADLVRLDGEARKVSLLLTSAQATLSSAERAANLAEADIYAEIAAEILAEQLGGHIAVQHIAIGESIPEVSQRTIFVQTNTRHEGKPERGGAVKLHAIITSSSPLDESALGLLPGMDLKRAKSASIDQVIGKSGVITAVEYGQRSTKRAKGQHHYSVNVRLQVAPAVPVLVSSPPAHQFRALTQGLQQRARRSKKDPWTSIVTHDLEVMEITDAKPNATVSKDGKIDATLTFTVPVWIRHGQHEVDQAKRVIPERIAAYERRFAPSIGRITSVKVDSPKALGVQNSEASVLQFPVTFSFVAQLQRDGDQ